MHAQGPSCAGRTVGVELRVVQSLRLGPRSGPWVSGHYCKQPAYDDRIIDLAITCRKDCGCNSVLAALEVKRKSTVLGAITRARDTIAGAARSDLIARRRAPHGR
jgi:hypothetical protein